MSCEGCAAQLTFILVAALMPPTSTVLVLLHNKKPGMRASQHTSAADFKTDPASGNKLKAIAAVVEMYFQEAEWLDCKQNQDAIIHIAAILCASKPE
jgi:hypothetical protein